MAHDLPLLVRKMSKSDQLKVREAGPTMSIIPRWEQLRQQGKRLGIVLALGLLGPVTVVVLSYLTGAQSSDFTRDTTSVLRGAPYVGFLSTVGVALWSATVAVCLLASWVTQGESSRFLLWSGLISLLLGFDDAFQLHETLQWGGLIPEKVTSGVYVLLLLAYLARFSRHILRTDYLCLGAALAVFAASQSIDLSHGLFLPIDLLSSIGRYIDLEDGLKFLGIVLWLSYFAYAAAAAVRSERLTP